MESEETICPGCGVLFGAGAAEGCEVGRVESREEPGEVSGRRVCGQSVFIDKGVNTCLHGNIVA